MAIRDFFLPHPQTHKKAHLISWQAILVYVLLFGILQLSFKFIAQTKPGVLGIASDVDQHKLIELTNSERQKLGLGILAENSALDQAAAAKAANMFAENYWAHYSPSGKDPWGFIKSAGYKFTVAGENLAKNFQNSDEVVVAWMNSPSHRENIVNGKYKEIGMAVVNGTLNGEETTLVVQMFGTPPDGFLASAADVSAPSVQVANLSEKASTLPSATPEATEVPTAVPSAVAVATPVSVVAAAQSPKVPTLVNPFQITKSVGLSVITLIAVLLLVDLYVLRKRGVARMSSHHVAHLSVLGLVAGTLMLSHPGEISTSAVSIVSNYLWTLP